MIVSLSARQGKWWRRRRRRGCGGRTGVIILSGVLATGPGALRSGLFVCFLAGIIGGRRNEDRDHRRHRRRGPGSGDAVRQGLAGGAHRLALPGAGGGGGAKGEGGAARGYGGGAPQRRGGRTRRGGVPDRPLGRPPQLSGEPRGGDRREGPR